MSDELSSALRELAADHETPPVVGGPATRARAMRRRRRRRTAVTLGAGATALALLGFALTLRLGGDPDHPDRRATPAVAPTHSAPPSAASPVPVSGTLDLPGRTLTVGGRALPIVLEFDSKSGALPGSTGLMTVVAKRTSRELPVDVLSKGAVTVDMPYTVELRDGRGQPLYIGSLTSELKALSQYKVGAGLVVLAPEDARRFYAGIGLGEAVSVTTAAG
ncbi:hypothetical protein ACWC09_03870 [Streptomyces sp. NPDC001617]